MTTWVCWKLHNGVSSWVLGSRQQMAQDEKPHCVYILSCSDDSLYTGMTCDLDRRLSDHRAGRAAQWTRKRLPVKLVFSLGDLDYGSAREVERYIKPLTRARKDALIARDPKMLALVERRVQPE
jgi:putative endonuclease